MSPGVPRHLADAVARVDLTRMLRNLGASLREAGALCAAWEMGAESCPCEQPIVHASAPYITRVGSWFPGCGRPVPGTES